MEQLKQMTFQIINHDYSRRIAQDFKDEFIQLLLLYSMLYYTIKSIFFER